MSQIQISSYSAVAVSTFHSNHRAHIFDSTLTAILAISTVARVGAIKVQLRVGAATTKRRDRRLIPASRLTFSILCVLPVITFQPSTSVPRLIVQFIPLTPIITFQPSTSVPRLIVQFIPLTPVITFQPSTSVPRLIFPIHSSSYAHYHNLNHSAMALPLTFSIHSSSYTHYHLPTLQPQVQGSFFQLIPPLTPIITIPAIPSRLSSSYFQSIPPLTPVITFQPSTSGSRLIVQFIPPLTPIITIRIIPSQPWSSHFQFNYRSPVMANSTLHSQQNNSHSVQARIQHGTSIRIHSPYAPIQRHAAANLYKLNTSASIQLHLIKLMLSQFLSIVLLVSNECLCFVLSDSISLFLMYVLLSDMLLLHILSSFDF